MMQNNGNQNTNILTLFGAPTLSEFRLFQLQSKIQKIFPNIKINGHNCAYFIKLNPNQSLNPSSVERLCALLHATQNNPYSELFKSNSFFLVAPRIGTLSSWRSKATDIVSQCGFSQIEGLEIGKLYFLTNTNHEKISEEELQRITPYFYDRMTESIFYNFNSISSIFEHASPKTFETIDILNKGMEALIEVNQKWGLSLNQVELDYLMKSYRTLNRNPTDCELMMFAQINSEHCRHKIFKAKWVVNKEPKSHSLFDMIRYTYEKNHDGILSAYSDNSAVFAGKMAKHQYCAPFTHEYTTKPLELGSLIKVETHNHPTAISPFPGAATGAGGEIRDEGATGRGSYPKMGLTGFTVSNLHIPDLPQPWERKASENKPNSMASPLEIMIEGPIGGARYNNEFGRPNVCGYFRTYCEKHPNLSQSWIGYHKPIMIAGGLGNIYPQLIKKEHFPANTLLVVLGGPAMEIGLGGGAASSSISGSQSEELDYASVQRDNAEMERRCQETINGCIALHEQNPILSIHDVGAGGLCNAVPELVHDCGLGAIIQLRSIPNAESGLSPLGIWCNEAQERYVLAISEQNSALFQEIAERERCPYAVIGVATNKQQLVVEDSLFNNTPISLPMAVLFGNLPIPTIEVDDKKELYQKQTADEKERWGEVVFEATSSQVSQYGIHLENFELSDIAKRILQLPACADKTFLITIGDRSVSGLIARDQMVGPWQIPVADCAVSLRDYEGYSGEAMAMGERTPLASINAASAAQMAVGEAILNLAGCNIGNLSNIKLSANWMAAPKIGFEAANLYQAVQSIAMDLCPQLRIVIPVGKDSLSMATKWQDKETRADWEVVSPVSLIISAFSSVEDVRKTKTPLLETTIQDTILVFIDLANGLNRLGGSSLAQVTNQVGWKCPAVNDVKKLQGFWDAMQVLLESKKILAYHDKSDGGLWVTLCEMAFASQVGVDIYLSALNQPEISPFALLFNEELGAVIQIKVEDWSNVEKTFAQFGLIDSLYHIAKTSTEPTIKVFSHDSQLLLSEPLHVLQQCWSSTSMAIQKLRDNPSCVEENRLNLTQNNLPKLYADLTFAPTPFISSNKKPKIAILREQGVNGHREMAAAFKRADFTCFDVTMTDLIAGKVNLNEFTGLVACGGFSYGDVLGAGRGWAHSILFNEKLRSTFAAFFAREETFSLGVCNGCQMLSQLKDLIPGAEAFPSFERNTSEQFEARLVMAKIVESPSILFKEMAGSELPIVVSHGEGRALFSGGEQPYVTLKYIDNHGQSTTRYPFNPNGSPDGVTGLTTKDGRVTIMMPHPERIFRTVQMSWHPTEWGEDSPWMQLFYNARAWVADKK